MVIEKGSNRIIYIALAVAAAAIVFYLLFSYFYIPKCASSTCFKASFFKCAKVSFTNAGENSTWFYSIQGLSGGECKIYVKAISFKTDVVTGTALTGKDMTCYIPKEILGAFMPEEKIEYCHGILKEEIQRLMIEKMHLYIIQNIGQLNQTIIV
jgi:hypothetical protein